MDWDWNIPKPVGTVVTYTCPPGYEMKLPKEYSAKKDGILESKCEEDGYWNPRTFRLSSVIRQVETEVHLRPGVD